MAEGEDGMVTPIVFSKEDQIAAKDKVILLVEDNENDALMTMRSLKRSNVLNEVTWVKDGAEALDYLMKDCLEEGKPLPQLVLLDIHMPKVDGIEVLRTVRGDSRINWLPIIIFTSSKEEKDLMDSYKLGVNSYICKPINFDEFAPVVSTLGCYWLIINQGPPASRMIP